MNPWEENRKEIAEIKDYSILLRYPVISKTMFIGNGGHFTEAQYKHLVVIPKYRALLRINGFGRPDRLLFDRRTTGNAVHMVYHLARFEQEMECDFQKDHHSVYEFGGGFGNFAEIFKRHAKNCDYYIKDFPELKKIQKIYLDACNIKTLAEPIPSDTYVSTWALSEADMEDRDKETPRLLGSTNILIAYAATFNDVDNIAYFKNIEKQLIDYKIWHKQIEVMDGNHFYFFACKK